MRLILTENIIQFLDVHFPLGEKKKNHHFFRHIAMITLPFSQKLMELILREGRGLVVKCGYFVQSSIILTSEMMGFEWCYSSLLGLKASFILSQ